MDFYREINRKKKTLFDWISKLNLSSSSEPNLFQHLIEM